MNAVTAFATRLAAAADRLGVVADDLDATPGRTYEIWAMLEIACRMLDRGISVSAVTHAGRPATTFRVRGGGGDMPDPGSPTGREPSHLVFRTGAGGVGELHVGLNHRGTSGSTHEIDVALLDARQAAKTRKSRRRSHYGAPLVAVELKKHSERRKLGQIYARALIGTMLDLDPCWPVEHVLLTGRTGRSSGSKRRVAAVSDAFLVTTTDVCDNTRRLVRNYPAVCCPRQTTASKHPLDAVAQRMSEVLDADGSTRRLR